MSPMLASRLHGVLSLALATEVDDVLPSLRLQENTCWDEGRLVGILVLNFTMGDLVYWAIVIKLLRHGVNFQTRFDGQRCAGASCPRNLLCRVFFLFIVFIEEGCRFIIIFCGGSCGTFGSALVNRGLRLRPHDSLGIPGNQLGNHVRKRAVTLHNVLAVRVVVFTRET